MMSVKRTPGQPVKVAIMIEENAHSLSITLDIDWKTASDFQIYIVSVYWSVTTITSVG